eukprot:TRINITY_DN43994_c0_g1_i1.p1 TRINITY_DN43994_c0_g1~~TRINITY_DN43994_c0_g1_i1.p1  ORF type:complete len:381 (+),score=100.66 TRINITY_DN43994_c0_g1_i1:81-1145(+)
MNGAWSCPQCTYDNRDADVECAMCGGPRPAADEALPLLGGRVPPRESRRRTPQQRLLLMCRRICGRIFLNRYACAALCFLLLIPLMFVLDSFTVVPVGHVGVVSVLGEIRMDPLHPGRHWVPPYVTTVTYMKTKLQVVSFTGRVATSEGLDVSLGVQCVYRLTPERAVKVVRDIGPDFRNKVLIPQFTSVIRDVTSRMHSSDLYHGSSRGRIVKDMEADLASLFGGRGFKVEGVLLSKLLLPPKLEGAIELKMRKQQEALQMTYVLEKQRKIAQQQAIQAGGIASFQRVISEGVSDRLLRWKGVESTRNVAGTCNPKLVVIGDTSQANMTEVVSKGLGVPPEELARYDRVFGEF